MAFVIVEPSLRTLISVKFILVMKIEFTTLDSHQVPSLDVWWVLQHCIWSMEAAVAWLVVFGPSIFPRTTSLTWSKWFWIEVNFSCPEAHSVCEVFRCGTHCLRDCLVSAGITVSDQDGHKSCVIYRARLTTEWVPIFQPDNVIRHIRSSKIAGSRFSDKTPPLQETSQVFALVKSVRGVPSRSSVCWGNIWSKKELSTSFRHLCANPGSRVCTQWTLS